MKLVRLIEESSGHPNASYVKRVDHVEQQISFSSKHLGFRDQDDLTVIKHEPFIALPAIADVVPRIDLTLMDDYA